MLKERVLENSSFMNINTDIEIEVEETPEFKTISKIKKLTEKYVKKQVRCQVTVKKVDQKTSWYDNVCTNCQKEVDIVEERYRCDACKRNIPYPDKRFKLATVCNDASGVLAIVFPYEEVQRIIGKDVFDIEFDDNEVGDGIPFPPSLLAFEKKEYLITLKIEEKNINKSCNIYTATEINYPQEMLGNHYPCEQLTTNNPVVSIAIAIDECRHSKYSPPTGKSTTKTRARPPSEHVPYEMDENLLIGKYKVVKTEKVVTHYKIYTVLVPYHLQNY
ncbi:uncharacterized protein LOC141717087 [Apium graveolens]|uniref:uncharacterized protein LOC141717087 n=1 Tax=Apium graveolens TaxID=4045 RepID=UPI003D79D707